MTQVDLFSLLRRRTHARVAIGRAGDGLPTAELLKFQLAHALARDAVHGAADFAGMAARLAPLTSIRVNSAAGTFSDQPLAADRSEFAQNNKSSDREVYLRRPDLGRRLGPGQDARLPRGPFDLVIVVADGLSAIAVDTYAAEVVAGVYAASGADGAGLTIGPVVLASQGRVAIGDEIAETMGASLVLLLIGERPGLSTADSLGAYLTFGARPGTRDNARNCVSNIHKDGLPPSQAVQKIVWLVREALRLRLTGVNLKEDAPANAISVRGDPPLL